MTGIKTRPVAAGAPRHFKISKSILFNFLFDESLSLQLFSDVFLPHNAASSDELVSHAVGSHDDIQFTLVQGTGRTGQTAALNHETHWLADT